LGEARREYDVKRDPVKGVSVRDNVYGKLETGDKPEDAAGKVVNLSPVDSPTSEDKGE
jgi:hypothetical protein